MRMLRASCAQFEQAKQGSFTYNQGYHLYSLSGAKRLVSIPNGVKFWGDPTNTIRTLLLVEHRIFRCAPIWHLFPNKWNSYEDGEIAEMMFSRSAHSSKLQKTNSGMWVRLKWAFFFSSISLYPKHITQMEEMMIRWTTRVCCGKPPCFSSVNLIEPNGPWLPVCSVE